MFTGIIEELGTVSNLSENETGTKIRIQAPSILSDVGEGDSISVNGICLTAAQIEDNYFTADVMSETLERTSLGELKEKSIVNLERAMQVGARFGGHIVSGHIDGSGEIVEITEDGAAFWYIIKTEPTILKYIVEKGSITVDGISLTVAKVEEKSFQVSLIPHTLNHTNLGQKKLHDKVNIENDMIAKYVEKLLT